MRHFADHWLAAAAEKGSPVCVGIDPVIERLPAGLGGEDKDIGAALAGIAEYGSTVIDAVADFVPAVKFQSACFERYRNEGVEVLYSLIREAVDCDLVVILDAKRGDIGISSEHYAAGVFEPGRYDDDLADDGAAPHAITANAYLGVDGLEPFCRDGRGAFALVRTSNPGGDPIQQAKLESGETVAEHVAGVVNELAQKYLGESGYSTLGAVVGATKRDEIESLRAIMRQSIFLVPGYGAQGGGADDVRACFNPDGQGAIITASRSVIYAYKKQPGKNWVDAVADAAKSFAAEVRSILPL